MAIWQNGSCLGLQTRISLFDSGYRLQIYACVVFNGNMFGFHPKVEGSNPFIRSSFGCDRILELSLEVPIGNRLRGWPIQALTKCCKTEAGCIIDLALCYVFPTMQWT